MQARRTEDSRMPRSTLWRKSSRRGLSSRSSPSRRWSASLLCWQGCCTDDKTKHGRFRLEMQPCLGIIEPAVLYNDNVSARMGATPLSSLHQTVNVGNKTQGAG